MGTVSSRDCRYDSRVKKGCFMPSLSPGSVASAPKVLIVILNWNSCDETIAATHSAEQMTYPNKHILLIDNGSGDDSVARLRQIEGASVTLLANAVNEGFTGGCNRGFDVALRDGFDYVWLLNNDATTDGETLTSLVRVAEQDARVGLVSPRIASLQEPAKNLNLGGLYRPEIPSFESTKVVAKATEWAERQPEKVMLMGTALLVRVNLIRAIGKLDDAMFAYWEDTDFSLRSILAGYRNRLDFASVIYHKEKDAGTHAMEMKPHYWYYMARNEIRFWRKHARSAGKLKALWWTYTFNMRNLGSLRGNLVSRATILGGLWDGWMGRTGPYSPERRMPSLLARLVELHSERLASIGPVEGRRIQRDA